MDYKQMCVQQGYVPSTCTMEGQMCWLLVNSQGDPCKGCNANRKICNGRHTPYENKDYNFMCSLDLLGEIESKRIEENKKRREEIIQQRKNGHINGYTRTILEVKWSMSYPDKFIEIIVKDIVNEKAYITKCRDINHMSSIIVHCCKIYNVEQIHVEENNYGSHIYDYLINTIKNIDIVPLRYTSLKLN